MLRFTTFGRRLAFAFVAPVVLFASCERISTSGFSGDVDVLLSRGEAYVDNLVVQPSEALNDAEIVALGYVERARLGLGSPFRLIEYVLRDPELPESVRQSLAYGILARTLEAGTYVVDPRVLDMAQLAGVPSTVAASQQQLRLIERAIETAPTATAGERTVRLAYLLASSERTVDPGYTTVIAHVAAMLGDRRRAEEDATLLLRTAARRKQDPLELMLEWRREHRFSVEQPPLATASIREDEAEARDGPVLAIALRTLAQRLSSPMSLVGEVSIAELPHQNPVLSGAAAERLQELTEKRNYPAQAPVAVAVEINREGLLSRPRLRRGDLAARERFTRDAWNEERLAAGSAILRARGADQGQRPPLILLQAATFLRVWNQEEVWFPGDAGPTAREIEARFGLEAIRFGEEVDESWRPYYLRMLGRSLTDLQRVLPTMPVRGLSIVIGELPGETRALALHEPRFRTLYMPPASGAGTVAHELAHDLDWQMARRRYSARGGYATDMAVRDNRGDRIAAAMMELSISLVQPASEARVSGHATRPAEVFARGMDWLVAAMLAREGRLGGYLTSFQDPVLTGYGTTRGPDITGAAVPALIAILESIAPVPEATRDWALDTYGPSRSLTAMELARVVTEAGAGLPPDRRMQHIREAGLRSYQAVSECRYVSADDVRRLVAAQRILAEASLAAAARGTAIDAIRELASQQGGEMLTAADEWLAWRLFGAPEPSDPMVQTMSPAFEDLLLGADLAISTHRPQPVASAFHLEKPPAMCGGNPFAADSPIGRFRASAGATF